MARLFPEVLDGLVRAELDGLVVEVNIPQAILEKMVSASCIACAKTDAQSQRFLPPDHHFGKTLRHRPPDSRLPTLIFSPFFYVYFQIYNKFMD
jgi:hypothetical protein